MDDVAELAAEREDVVGNYLPGWLGRFFGEHSSAALPLTVSSGGYVSQLLVKAGAGSLFGFTIRNSNAAAQFVQLHDVGAPIVAGAVPIWIHDVATVASLDRDFIPYGLGFQRGMVIALSSTDTTFTAVTNGFISARYV